jgi:predicted small metal-binding protein
LGHETKTGGVNRLCKYPENRGKLNIDCREFPSEMNCSVAISADTDEELLYASVQHAVAVHSHKDTAELRDQIRQIIKEESPSAEMSR